MKDTVVALEISHKYLKIVVGAVKDNAVVVEYAHKSPLFHPLENGVIKDHLAIVKELSKINPINDEKLHFSQLIDNAIVVLPPFGLEIYETNQYTSVISSEKIVGDIDIKNIYSIIRNKKLPVDNQLIDIIPDSFMLDNGNRYAQAPIGKESSAITVYAKVHTLPKRINDEHTNCLVHANIAVKRRVVAPFAVSELLATYNDVPKTYFLVDIGANSTSISLVDNNQLFASRSFPWGGDNITNAIITSFNISEKEAEDIKILYGLDYREMKFAYPIAKSLTPEGEREYYVSDLNKLIEKELANFTNMLNVSLEQISNAYNIEGSNSMPLIVIGGGSQLKGLKPYFENRFTTHETKFLKPKSIGASDPSLFGVLGSILVNKKYPLNKSEVATHVSVTRDE